MKVSALKLVALKMSVVLVLGLGAAGSAQAQDGLQIAAGVLQGVANGLNGGGGMPNNGGFPNGNGGGFPNGNPGFTPNVPQFDPWGNSHTIYDSRLQPGANAAIPGTHHAWNAGPNVSGTRYLGVDGRWHGTTTIQRPDGTLDHRTYARPKQFPQPQRVNTPRSYQRASYPRAYGR